MTFLSLLAIILVSPSIAWSSPILPPSAHNLFHTALSYTDSLYDPLTGYLFSSDPSTPGQHDTRSSAMYATGLLLRNAGEGADVERASAIIERVAGTQYGLSTSDQEWFGTYPHAPEEPRAGSGGGKLYGTLIYGNWDPNWRDFVGTAWCLALATSSHLLPPHTIKTIEDSLLLAARGTLLRFQGRGEYANSVNANMSADNLDEAYTNPWLMGTFLLGYIGDRLNDTSLRNRSEADAQKIYDLFTYGGFNTFSEYNSGTYTGVDLYALALWVHYSPPTSKMRTLGAFMLERTLTDIGTLYHAGLRNLAGPWDRTYGFDMTRYHSVMGQLITALAPEGMGPIPSSLPGSLHVNTWDCSHLLNCCLSRTELTHALPLLQDYPCFAALNAFLSPIIEAHAPARVLHNFASFDVRQERTFHRKVRTNTEDPEAVRNVSAWLGEGVAVGGQSLDEPFVRQSSMVPAIIQWALPSPSPTASDSTSVPRIAYIALSPPTASVLNATASRRTLSITLPPSQRWANATLPSSVVFAVGGFEASGIDMTRGLEAAPGLNLEVETNGMGGPEVAYNASMSFNGFYSYYVTYPVTTSWPTVPSITLRF